METLESGLSIVSLAAFIWVLNYLLPKARREYDSFATICALLTAVLTLFGFFLFGIAMR
jgi:type II secretory pathway component PulF